VNREKEIDLLKFKIILLKQKMENYRKTIVAIRKELNNMNININEQSDNNKS